MSVVGRKLLRGLMSDDSGITQDGISPQGTVTTVLAWRDDFGWDVTRGSSTHPLLFDRTAWQALPAALQPDAVQLYRKFAESRQYLGWWADACGGTAPGVRRFAVRTPAGHWERPWESTIAALPERRWQDVAMVRVVGGRTATVAPQNIGRPLRVLVVQGQRAAPDLPELDLKAEFDALTEARASLDAAVMSLVPPIQARAPGRAELVGTLSEVEPTLLWFSGHATESPPGFLLADGSWLKPEDLASAIGDAAMTSGVVPLYVVLWACKTARNERFAAPGAAPPFIRELATVGVSAVLATLGPLADDIAPGVAAAVLRSVALGRPLDHAVARGRAALMAEQLHSGRDDWACPVVWCVDLPAGDIIWSDAAAPGQRQDLARRLLPPGIVLKEPDATVRAQARIWSQHRRVWVVSRMPGNSEVRTEWLGRVLAQQQVNPRMVVALDFRQEAPRDVLGDWAGRVRDIADDFDDHGRQFRNLAQTALDNPRDGWRELCHDERFTLALIRPREREGNDWLWDTLRDAAAAAVVLSDSFPEWAAAAGWKAEKLMIDPVDTEFDPLRHSLAWGLAVLGYPAAAQDLAAIDAAQVQLLKDAGFLVETRAGCVMPLSHAMPLMDRLDPGQIVAAHRRAFEMLDGPAAHNQIDARANEALLQARLQHAESWADAAALSTAQQELMDFYRRHDRASALLGVFGTADFRAIGEVWKVWAGGAHLATGSPDEARDLLEDVHDEELEPIENAQRLALLAEVEKSSGAEGSKTRVRELLQEALSVLRSEPEDDAVRVIRLTIEHDLARLTHFIDGEPAAAIPQYRQISNAWQVLRGHGLDRAITLRNLAEAKMMVADMMMAGVMEPERDAPDAAAVYDSAAVDLDIARDNLPLNTGHPVAAELEYLAGRLAERRQDEEDATRRFQLAASRGLTTNHLMLVAIVEARLFWREVERRNVDEYEYDAGEWEERARVLRPYQRHAWAARVLISGYLRSAHQLMARGYRREAVAPLREARSLLAANPAFDGGSDRDRIVATCAGLALTGTDPVPWNDLPGRFGWFAEWMAAKDADTPEKAWEATR